MRMMMAISLSALVLGSSGLAWADSCSCNYEGPRPCSASIVCGENEKARCSCTSKGCTASCGSAGPNQLTDVFSFMTTSDMLLDGIAAHFEKDSGWTFVTRTPRGAPLSLERRSETYVDMTYGELLEAVADDFGLCVEFHEKKRVVVFKSACR